jgi:hypothetical protein
MTTGARTACSHSTRPGTKGNRATTAEAAMAATCGTRTACPPRLEMTSEMLIVPSAAML